MKILLLSFFLLVTTFNYSQADDELPIITPRFQRKEPMVYDKLKYFAPFLGNWTYTDGKKEFRINIQKTVTTYGPFPNSTVIYYRDELLLTYQKFEDGKLIFTSPSTDITIGTFGDGFISSIFIDYERENTDFGLTLKKISPEILQPGQTHYDSIRFIPHLGYYKMNPDGMPINVPDNVEMTWCP